jgi:hypothetical protein
MVVDKFDIVRIAILAAKANTPLVVDANGMPPSATAGECFQPVAGRGSQIIQ